MQAIPDLPVEIIVEIIAIVAECDSEGRRDIWTLEDASLVSRTWNTVCRPHIFHTVHLSLGDSSTRISFLHFEAPYLSEYIHEVKLSSSSWNSNNNPTPEWLPECFGRLKNLRALHLDFQREFNLLTAAAPLSAGIMSLISAPHLRKLYLHGWSFANHTSDLLNIFPATLEELIIKDACANDIVDEPATIRLEALRSMKLFHASHSTLEFQNFIECPNLRSFTVEWYMFQHWNLPSWIPDSLSDLTLLAVFGCNIPEFGTAIRPSAVTIELRGYAPYFKLFTWIKDCIYRLPFPNSIRTLVFDIESAYSIYESVHGLYPETSDYTFVSQFLQQLHECGELRDVVLNIKGTAEVGSADDELHLDEARELSKLQTGFEPLLRANVLKADFTLARYHTAAFGPVMHCRVGAT